jgi:hypothetical protein
MTESIEITKIQAKDFKNRKELDLYVENLLKTKKPEELLIEGKSEDFIRRGLGESVSVYGVQVKKVV